MAKGDLLFYRSTGGPIDRLITATTQPGPYTHVGIAWGDGLVLAAESVGGVRVRPLSVASMAGRIDTYPLTQHASADHLALALGWAAAQVHDRYGVADIISQVFRILRWPLYVGIRHTYDCSDLAACVAALALQQDALWCWVLDNRQQITPNALAAYLGLVDNARTDVKGGV